MAVVATGAENGGAPPAETVTMGGPWVVQRPGWAFYRAPGHGVGASIFNWVSEGTQQVRVFYSTTSRPMAPQWVECGHGPVEFDNDYPHDQWLARARCVLAPGDQPRDVRLIASVANTTPVPADPDPVNDAGSDVTVGINSYRSRASDLSLWAEGAALDTTRCHLLRMRGHDQREVPLWHANLDLHLRAPRGSASFATGQHSEDPAQAPDQNHDGSTRDGMACDDGPDPPSQARHAKGDRDIWHIESGSQGADYYGDFDVAVSVSKPARTSVFAWIDQNDDDVWQQSEPSDVLLYREDTKIEPDVSRSKHPEGLSVLVGGELDGVTPCDQSRLANVYRRTSRTAPWRKVGEAILGSHYDQYHQVVRRTTWFRLIAPAVKSDYECERAASPAVRVRMRR